MPKNKTSAGAIWRQIGTSQDASLCLPKVVPPMKFVPCVVLIRGQHVEWTLGREAYKTYIVDPKANHDPKAYGQLLQGDQRAAYLGRRDLGVVDGNDHGERADAHSRDEAPCEDAVVTGCDGGDLDDDAEHEDGDGDEYTILSRDGLGEEAGQQGPEPRPELKNGSEPALLGLAGVGIQRIVLAHI